MRAEEHPDYPEERDYLDRTLKAIRSLLAPYLAPRKVETAHAEAAEAVARLLTERMRRLHAVRLEPYFGRVDFKRAGSDTTRKVYIGRASVPALSGRPASVYDWRAPIAALFYANDYFGATYTAPNGPVSGDVALRRQFKIASGVLIEISDKRPVEAEAMLPRQRSMQSHSRPLVESDEFLLRVLGERRDGGLRDIVATIQAQQNALIRAALSDSR